MEGSLPCCSATSSSRIPPGNPCRGGALRCLGREAAEEEAEEGARLKHSECAFRGRHLSTLSCAIPGLHCSMTSTDNSELEAPFSGMQPHGGENAFSSILADSLQQFSSESVLQTVVHHPLPYSYYYLATDDSPRTASPQVSGWGWTADGERGAGDNYSEAWPLPMAEEIHQSFTPRSPGQVNPFSENLEETGAQLQSGQGSSYCSSATSVQEEVNAEAAEARLWANSIVSSTAAAFGVPDDDHAETCGHHDDTAPQEGQGAVSTTVPSSASSSSSSDALGVRGLPPPPGDILHKPNSPSGEGRPWVAACVSVRRPKASSDLHLKGWLLEELKNAVHRSEKGKSHRGLSLDTTQTGRDTMQASEEDDESTEQLKKSNQIAGYGTRSGGNGNVIRVKLVWQTKPSSSGYEKNADGEMWRKDGTKPDKNVKASRKQCRGGAQAGRAKGDSLGECVESNARVYYKCSTCFAAQKPLSKPCARKNVQNIQGFPGMFLVRYKGTHTHGAATNASVGSTFSETVIWKCETSKGNSSGGCWPPEAVKKQVAEALMSATGCKAQKALESATHLEGAMRGTRILL